MGCHQGLGFERMFDCFDYTGHTLEEAKELWNIKPVTLETSDDFTRCEIIGYKDTDCFRMESYSISGSCPVSADGVFCGMYFLSGKGKLVTKSGEVPLSGGDQFFVPASADDFKIIADKDSPVEMFRCYGPKA